MRLRGFVSHAFADAVYEGGRKAFKRRINELVRKACADFAGDIPNLEYKLYFEATEYGRPLMPRLREEIAACDFLIADITQIDDKPVNPNVMYELGFAMALKRRILVIRRNSHPPPPSDIGDLLAGTYERLKDIPSVFFGEMVDIVRTSLARADREANRIQSLITMIWFPAETGTISIVCSREVDATPFADSREANFVRIDKFEDRDALIDLATFFARRYPEANVIRLLCEEISQDALDTNLVILGGPGCETDEGNNVGRDLMHTLKSCVSYADEEKGLIWDGEPTRETVRNARGCVIEDWGTILAAPNPYNKQARIVLIHGTTTFGTLGAARALIDTNTAIPNHHKLEGMGIRDRLSGNLNFEALVKVEVDSTQRIKSTTIERIRRISA